VSRMHHALSDQSVRAATVLGSWCDIPGLVPQNDLTAAFNDKKKHLKNTEKSISGAPDMVESEAIVIK
jgi:hypothetical protein